MAIEMLSATAPLAMSAAIVLAGGRLRERRRRLALNRALHELRRPLQALVLAPGDPARLDPVLDALTDLDGAINGESRQRASEAIELRHVAEAVVERWSTPAAGAATRPTLRWRAGAARVFGDRAQLTRALDNLLANAIEHGHGPIDVVGTLRMNRLRVQVHNAGAGGLRDSRDPRHGHGLEIVREVAAAHHGKFMLRHTPADTLAVLELPLAGSASQPALGVDPPDAA